MLDPLIITALENACLNEGDVSLQLIDQLRRYSLLDIDCPLDLSSLCHASDLTNPFNQ